MRKLFAIFLLLGWGSVHASTTLIDFDDLSSGSYVPTPYQGYLFEGFNDNGTEPDWTWSASVGAYSGGSALKCAPSSNYWAEVNCGFSMEHISGGLFSLNSVDLAWAAQYGDAHLSVRGFSESGESIAYDSLDIPVVSGLEEHTFVFDSAWANLSRVEFLFQADGYYPFAGGAVDNISATAVPIPAAVWLFGSALAGLGWLRRKQTV